MAKKSGFFSALFGGGKSGNRGGSRSSKSRSSAPGSKRGRSSAKTKTPARSSARKCCIFNSRSDVGKIYKTTDGYFTQNSAITKKRHVAVIDQRKSDGALAVTKIYSKYDENGKERKGKAYIDDLTLSPKKHSSLKKESIVGTQVHIGTKKAGAQTPAEKNHRPIYKWELEKTRDKLTKAELETVQAKVKNDTPEHRATHERTMKKWHDGFKKDK